MTYNGFDLNYIASQLGLVRVGDRLINTNAIVRIVPEPHNQLPNIAGCFILCFSGGDTAVLTMEQMAEFEAAIRVKREDIRREQAETMEFQMRTAADVQERMMREQTSKANKSGIVIPELVPKGRGRA